MHSRKTCGCPLSSWRMSVPGPHQRVTKVPHIAESVSSAPRALLCRSSPVSLLKHWADGDVNVEHKGEPWSERLLLCPSYRKFIGGTASEAKAQLLLSACSPFLLLLCSGTEALGSCSSCAEWELCSSALAQISPCIWRPGVGGMGRRGTGALCSLTLQSVPKLKSLSSYSSRDH